jgi:hypothetical protein
LNSLEKDVGLVHQLPVASRTNALGNTLEAVHI